MTHIEDKKEHAQVEIHLLPHELARYLDPSSHQGIRDEFRGRLEAAGLDATKPHWFKRHGSSLRNNMVVGYRL